jgi:hypothetical protein
MVSHTLWRLCPCCLHHVQALQLNHYELLVNFASRCLYIAGFPIRYSSVLKNNSGGMELTVHETPTCGPPMALTGQLEAHFNLSSQRMCGVAWLESCWLDHSFWINVELLSALPDERTVAFTGECASGDKTLDDLSQLLGASTFWSPSCCLLNSGLRD